MTRADVRTFAWMVPLALVLMLGCVFRADPCIDDKIANDWNRRYPPVVETVPKLPGTPDAIVVENPYGIVSCDYFPDALGSTITFSILGFVSMFVGLLSAWNFQHSAKTRAATITFVTLCSALGFSQLVYLPDNLDYFQQRGYRPLMHIVLYLLLLAAGAGLIAWLAAKCTLGLRRRG